MNTGGVWGKAETLSESFLPVSGETGSGVPGVTEPGVGKGCDSLRSGEKLLCTTFMGAPPCPLLVSTEHSPVG